MKKQGQSVISTKHYKDEYEGTDKGFAGEGMCLAKNIKVDACDSCDDDFHCFKA